MHDLRSFIDVLNRNKEQIVAFLAGKRGFSFKLNDDSKNATIANQLKPANRDKFVEHRIIQLYLLHSTLYRLIEDFSIISTDKINLVYAIDSTEFRAYVDPLEHIKQYIFKIENDNYSELDLLEKARKRKYQLEVLFGKKLVSSKNELNHLLYPKFNDEIFAYKQFLLKRMLKEPMSQKLINYIKTYKPVGKTDTEKAENFVNEIKKPDNGFINVFVKKFVEQTNKLQRFKDIFAGDRNFREPKLYDWKGNIEITDALAAEISEIDYNERIFSFFYTVLKRFNLHRSDDSLIIDCKTLAYICTINIYCKQKNIPRRVALLSSSSLINIFTKSIIDYFDYSSRFSSNKYNDFRHIIYVRYPTLLINQIRFTDAEQQSDENSKHIVLFKLVENLILKMTTDLDYKKGEKIKKEDQADLKTIKEDWSELRENLIIEQNFKDAKEKVDQNRVSNEDKELFEAINNIGFDNLYNAVHTLNTEIIDEILERYLILNAEKLNSIDFHARVDKIAKDSAGNTRYLISSLNTKTCQNVFQIPKAFIDDGILIKSPKENVFNFDIEKLKKFKYSNSADHLLIYANILSSALLRDWTIVEIVTQKFIEDYEGCEEGGDLVEEVKYINHLANRGILYNNRSRIEFAFKNEMTLNSELNEIEHNLNNALEHNPNNPIIQLCKSSFAFERAVIEIESSTYKVISFKQALDNQNFKCFFQNEYVDNQFYLNYLNLFEDHPFKDNLKSMYFKVLLAFYIYCKVTFNDIEAENLEILESRLKEYSTKLKNIIDAEFERDNLYPEKRCLTNYVAEIAEQIISSNFDYEAIRKKSKKIRRNSFFGRFILKKSLSYVKTQNVVFP